MRSGTDYAFCQGLKKDSNGNSPYWLRSIGNSSNSKTLELDLVLSDGTIEYISNNADYVFGVVPLINVNTSDVRNDTKLVAPASTTVNFNANGGSQTVYTRTVYIGGCYGILPEATKTNYIFKGWATTSSALTPNVTPTTTVTNLNNHTLYAVYEPAYIVVSFNANGGSVSPSSKTITNYPYLSSIEYGELPTPTAPSGKVFSGWYTSENVPVTSTSTVTQKFNHTLTAKWIEKIKLLGYVKTCEIDYRTTITFTASIFSPTSTDEVHWFIDGVDQNTTEKGVTSSKYTVKEAESDFTVQAKLIRSGSVIASTEIETVKVKQGFFDKLVAFFRGLFNKLPVVEQK